MHHIRFCCMQLSGHGNTCVTWTTNERRRGDSISKEAFVVITIATKYVFKTTHLCSSWKWQGPSRVSFFSAHRNHRSSWNGHCSLTSQERIRLFPNIQPTFLVETHTISPSSVDRHDGRHTVGLGTWGERRRKHVSRAPPSFHEQNIGLGKSAQCLHRGRGKRVGVVPWWGWEREVGRGFWRSWGMEKAPKWVLQSDYLLFPPRQSHSSTDFLRNRSSYLRSERSLTPPLSPHPSQGISSYSHQN